MAKRSPLDQKSALHLAAYGGHCDGHCVTQLIECPWKKWRPRRSQLDRNRLRVLGAIYCLGSDRRVAARLPPIHERAISHLDLAKPSVLRGLYYTYSRACGHQPTVSWVGCARVVQVRRNWYPRVH